MTKGERREHQARKRRQMPKHGMSLVHIMNSISKRANAQRGAR